MKEPNRLERFTVMVGRRDVRRLKFLAVDRDTTASALTRAALKTFLAKAENPEAPNKKPEA